jgi:hypothetical protein
MRRIRSSVTTVMAAGPMAKKFRESCFDARKAGLLDHLDGHALWHCYILP